MKRYLLNIGLMAAIAIALGSCRPGAVVVKTRPNPPMIVRPLSPGRGYVWVNGDWILRGNQYVYREGYWAQPRHRNTSYVTGYWRETRNGSYWVPGHWR